MSGMTLERGRLDALKRLAAATKAERGGVSFPPPGWESVPEQATLSL